MLLIRLYRIKLNYPNNFINYLLNINIIIIGDTYYLSVRVYNKGVKRIIKSKVLFIILILSSLRARGLLSYREYTHAKHIV